MIAVAGWVPSTTTQHNDTRRSGERTVLGVIERHDESDSTLESMRRAPIDLENPDDAPEAALETFADLTGHMVFCDPIRADIKRLDYLAQLPENWDSYGAAPVSPDALAMAYLLLATTAGQLSYRVGSKVRPYVIVPIADGGVQIEWRGLGGLIEVSVGPEETLGYLLVREKNDQQVTEEQDDVPQDEVLRLIAKVVRG